MTIVITDHHEVPFEEKDGAKEYIVPNADAVVNQNRQIVNIHLKKFVERQWLIS